MPLVQWSKPTTNIPTDTEAYEFLSEINKIFGFDKVFVEQTTITNGGFFKPKHYTYYSIYFDVGQGEYQHMMSFKKLDLQDVECYLLGYLGGLTTKL